MKLLHLETLWAIAQRNCGQAVQLGDTERLLHWQALRAQWFQAILQLRPYSY